MVGNKFGASSLRKYYQTSVVDKEIFLEVQQLGKALGADGFTNISCIQSVDGGGRYVIEADMRANAWIVLNF